MDTKEFLQAILPDKGIYIVASASPRGMRHEGFETIDEAVQFIQMCDAQGTTVYHACAAYKSKPYFDDNGVKISRRSPNWRSAKAFWVDIDCGADKAEKGIGYATKTEAVKALATWCSNNKFPLPLGLSSGRGVHAYWCLTEELDPSAWTATATSLKKLMQHDGLLADPSRTADFASILRPVGTFNRKDPASPKPVKVLFPAEPVNTQAFVQMVADRASAVLGELPAPPAWMTEGVAQDDDLCNSVIDSSAKACADKCRQIAIMRDTQGDVGYDHWRGVIGIIKFCTEGKELAHEWSARRAETGHTNVDVDTRFDTWGSAPTTCAFFEKCNPEGCANCQFKGSIKTPLVLGRQQPVQQEELSEGIMENDPSAQTVQIVVPEFPTGYAWDGKHMIRYLPNDKGVLEAHPFSRTRFYLVDRIRNAEGRFEFQARAHLPRGIVREFSLPGQLIGAGGRGLFEFLGSYEIFTNNAKDAQYQMHAYLKDSVQKLTEEKSVNNTYTHFGWQEDGSFLLGSRLYKPDGSIIEALLSGNAADQKKVFPAPRGTVEAYAERINWIYNRMGMEPFQYMICSLWAAPLVELSEPTYNGIPCALTGAASGKGKTTCAMAALYAFGEAFPGLSFSGKEGATAKAQATFLGTVHSLPVLFDEITNKDTKALSDLCYALSNGVENMRLRSSGGRVSFGDREMWRTQVALTGNTHIAARLAIAGNTEAETMRIFEIRVDQYDTPKLDPVAVSTALSEIEQNTGAAGAAIVQYLVTHRSEAITTLLNMYEKLSVDASLMREPKYRFYRNHMACTLAMSEIAHKLGIMSFDLDKLRAFAVKAVRAIFDEAADISNMTPSECLARMLTDFGPKITTTPTLTVGKNEPAYAVSAPQGLYGRAVRGNEVKREKEYDGKLFLSANAVRNWCSEHRVDVTALANELQRSGLLIDRRYRISLGRDTNVTSSQQRCWVLDLNKIEETTND